MILRRRFIVLAAAGLGSAWLGLPAAAGAQTADQAISFIRQTGNQLVAVANGPGSVEQRQEQLAAIIERAVDVDGIARFCLGRFVRVATPQQLQAYMQLFHHVLAISIAGHLGEYRGVGFTLGRTLPAEGSIAVDSTVTRPNNAPADVQWVVGLVDGQPKIQDVIAEGTSLRLTQRADYASYMSRNGYNVAALIAAMRRQAGG